MDPTEIIAKCIINNELTLSDHGHIFVLCVVNITAKSITGFFRNNTFCKFKIQTDNFGSIIWQNSSGFKNNYKLKYMTSNDSNYVSKLCLISMSSRHNDILLLNYDKKNLESITN